MAPQLQLNQGPQDALLFDNTRSYFTNVGYVRTSNFQMELRDVDAQNTPTLGGTVNFVIPKAADLLGPTDLCIEFDKAGNYPGSADGTTNTGEIWGWVESVGFAMIDKITFSVGSHDVETLTGDHLNIMNELMRDDKHRYGFAQQLKTGRPLVQGQVVSAGAELFLDSNKAYDCHDRIIAYDNIIKEGKKLIIPLGLFFTTHPSKYFPIAAIAGCNDIRIAVKLKTLKEITMCHGILSGGSGALTNTAAKDAGLSAMTFASGNAIAKAFLRCHYVHVTGPEATALMNKEHVRLMKLFHGNEISEQKSLAVTTTGEDYKWSIDLSFLHPVTELIVTIRKVADMGSDQDNDIAPGTSIPAKNTAQTKNYFAYHGSGKGDPNQETIFNTYKEKATASILKESSHVRLNNIKLTLNGQTRHLDGQGVDRNYLMNRLMPMLHSNTSTCFDEVSSSSIASVNFPENTGDAASTNEFDLKALARKFDRKEIYVFPFALAPESASPSGSVNFSKVSHAKLDLDVTGFAGATGNELFQVDVYGVYYNWLAIKDGRALTSFA